jgi:hypothetical protein
MSGLFFQMLQSGRRSRMPSLTATCRACFRCGEIRILDLSGAIERIIPFDETDRRL